MLRIQLQLDLAGFQIMNLEKAIVPMHLHIATKERR
jgi:hypothetical protein